MARKKQNDNNDNGFRVLTQRTEMVPVDAVEPHPRNVNQGNLDAVADSIQKNGFYGSLLVQESTGYILGGTHRWKSAKAAGASEIPVTYLDVTDDQARRIMLADNRTSRLGHDDPLKLAELLQEIANETGDLGGTGFDQAALDTMLESLAQEFAGGDGGGGNGEDPEDSGDDLEDHGPEELPPSNVGLSIGEFRLVVSRGEYEKWLEGVRDRVGFEKPAILAEIVRLLGIQ